MSERAPDALALPWTEGIVGNPRIYATDGLGPLSGLVAEVASCGDPLVRRERLSFIVKAVNAHDKLVDRLKVVTDTLESLQGPDWETIKTTRALLSSLTDKDQT